LRATYFVHYHSLDTSRTYVSNNMRGLDKNHHPRAKYGGTHVLCIVTLPYKGAAYDT